MLDRPRVKETRVSRRVREKLLRRNIERYHINQAFRHLEMRPRRAKYGAYAIVGRDEGGRKLLVIFHLRGSTAHIATARQVR